MWVLLFFPILLIGYFYIDNHTPSKIKFKNSKGWNAYFQIASKGCEITIYGIFGALLLELFIYLLELFFNFIILLLNLFTIECKKFDFFNSINDWVFNFNCISYIELNLNFLSLIIIIFIVIMAFSEIENAKEESKSQEKMIEVVREEAKKNPLNELLLEAVDSNLSIMVTLKSKKVYIGRVDGSRFFNIHSNYSPFISVIPMHSGYRDKDTLSFVKNCDYAAMYKDQKITLDSEPISLEQFRRIIPLSEVESVSLYNENIAESFSYNSDTSSSTTAPQQ